MAAAALTMRLYTDASVGKKVAAIAVVRSSSDPDPG
jgi:hypothetical protein